jgi:Tfp pilus assembly protein PilO
MKTMLRDARQIDALGRLALMALCLAFVALVSRQVVRPMLAARHDLRAFRGAVQILNRAEGRLDRLDQQVRLAGEEISAGEARLPRTLNLDDFLLRTEGVARACGARIEAVTPREVVSHPLYRELAIDLRVTGPCVALYDFLVRLERDGQLSRVKEMRMVGADAEGRSALELSLTLYFSPAERA